MLIINLFDTWRYKVEDIIDKNAYKNLAIILKMDKIATIRD